MKTFEKRAFLNLLNTGLTADQIAKICNDMELRLSNYGGSKYIVENGELIYRHDYGDRVYTETIKSVYDLEFYTEEKLISIEYSQEITPDIIQALRNAQM